MAVRPTFLTILCVLTFFNSGMGIYTGLMNYINPEKGVAAATELFEKTSESISEQSEDEQQEAMALGMLERFKPLLNVPSFKFNAIATVLASVLSVLGAIQMWGLRRQGFKIYLAGVAVSVLAPILIYGGTIGVFIGIAAALAGGLMLFLYSRNLPAMY